VPDLPHLEWDLPHLEWDLPHLEWDLPHLEWDLPHLEWDLYNSNANCQNPFPRPVATFTAFICSASQDAKGSVNVNSLPLPNSLCT
jgi:hypothetical protein